MPLYSLVGGPHHGQELHLKHGRLRPAERLAVPVMWNVDRAALYEFVGEDKLRFVKVEPFELTGEMSVSRESKLSH